MRNMDIRLGVKTLILQKRRLSGFAKRFNVPLAGDKEALAAANNTGMG